MDDFGSEVAYPTVEQICEVNRRMIDQFGGFFQPPDNLLNLDSLKYVLDITALPLCGFYLYPTLKEKAAAIAHQIISRHIFHDGNKRTATSIAWEFLRSNGMPVFIEQSILGLTEAIAQRVATYEELLAWLHGHQEA